MEPSDSLTGQALVQNAGRVASPAQPAGFLPWGWGCLSPLELSVFAESLAGLVRARIPLPQALRMIGQDSGQRRLQAVLEEVRRDVDSGVPLADALRKHPGAFPDLFSRLIEQGSASSDLHAALLEIVREFRSQARFREALWSQMLSPLATCIGLMTLIFVLTIWHLPQMFVEIYDALGVDLPLPTRVTIAVSNALNHPGLWPAVGVTLAALAALLTALLRSARPRYWFQRLMLCLPMIGPFLATGNLARFCRLLSMLLRRGLPLDSSLMLVRESLGFAPMQVAVEAVIGRIEQGEAFSVALCASKLFPPTFVEFVKGAEQHGDLPDTLSRLAEFYEERCQHRGEKLRFFIFLASQIVIGVVVMFVILSVFMPLFRIQEALVRK